MPEAVTIVELGSADDVDARELNRVDGNGAVTVDVGSRVHLLDAHVVAAIRVEADG